MDFGEKKMLLIRLITQTFNCSEFILENQSDFWKYIFLTKPQSLILWSLKQLWVDLVVCFGLLSCWKMQPKPICSYLSEIFSFKMLRFFIEAMIHCTLTIHYHVSYSTILFKPKSPWVFVAKKVILVSSDHRTQFQWTPGAYTCS